MTNSIKLRILPLLLLVLTLIFVGLASATVTSINLFQNDLEHYVSDSSSVDVDLLVAFTGSEANCSINLTNGGSYYVSNIITIPLVESNTWTDYTFTNLLVAPGTEYTMNLNCTDDNSLTYNVNTPLTTYFYDPTYAPGTSLDLTINTPVNDFIWNLTQSVEVNFSTIKQKVYVYDLDCYLVANDTNVSDDLSVSVDGDYKDVFNFTTLSTGLYDLSLYCNSSYGEVFTNDSFPKFVYDVDFSLGSNLINYSVVDTQSLFVESNPNSLDISFNLSAKRDYALPATCNIFTNTGNISSNSLVVTQNNTINSESFNLAGLDNGTYNLSLNCTTYYGESFIDYNFSKLIVETSFQTGVTLTNYTVVNLSSTIYNVTPNITLSMNVSALKDYAFPISCYVNTDTGYTSDNPLVFAQSDNASIKTSLFNFTGLTEGTHSLDLECITNYGESFIDSSFANFIYDATNPTISTYSWFPVINRPSLIYFLISDTFSNINFSTIRALINNSDNTYNLYSANIDEINCGVVGLGYNCSLNISNNVAFGTYNITLYGNDSAMNNISNTTEIILRNSIFSVPVIDDNGTNISTPTIFVNWTWSPSLYIDYYNLSLIVTPYGGSPEELLWVVVDNNTDNYTFTNVEIANHYGDLFRVEITPVDIIGNTASPTSTDGLLLLDTSAPIPNGDGSYIIPDHLNWVQSNSSLNLFFNFTDNETGIDYYTYSIGTAVYPSDGWNSTVSNSISYNANFTVINLDLEEGEAYYVSARAKNNYPYYWENSESTYFSSSPIYVDSVDPSGGFISYGSGPITTPTLDITYGVSSDATSGFYNASIMKKTATYFNSQCGSFSGGYDFVSYVEPNNLTNVSSNLESGFCYIFYLFTYDKAGRLDIVSSNFVENLTVDLTPPSVVDLTIVDGYLTSDRTIDAFWTSPIDLESGVKNYEYALSTSNDNFSDNIVSWTNISYGINNVSLKDLGLVHLESYYFKVRTYNNQGTSPSVAVSHPIAYVDTYPPANLNVVKIGDDTSSPWIDNTTNSNATIILTGEEDLSCIWSYYDIEYITPGPAFPYVHACYSNGTGSYLCNISQEDISPLEEGIYDVYVSCRDQAGNIQRSNTNTNIHFAKDNGFPLVTVYNLADFDLYTYGSNVYVNIQEATLINANYTVTNDFETTDSGVLSLGNNTITLDVNADVALHTLSIYAIDSYGNENITNVTFNVNSSIPAAYMSIPNSYINSNKNVTLVVSFFNNYSYNISGTGAISRNYFYNYTNTTNITTSNKSNIFINVSDFDDGNYTILVTVNNSINGINRSNNYTLDFVVDKVVPDITPIPPEYPSIVYDNETAEIFITVVGDVKNISVEFNGSSSHLVEPVDFDTVIVPNAQRYRALLTPKTVNESMVFNWTIYDLAGNSNSYSNSIFVPNRNPYFLDNSSIFTYLAGVPFELSLIYDDNDITQDPSDYNCSMESDPSFDLSSNPMSCYINLTNPLPGTYSFNLTVNDYHNGVYISNITKRFNITFLNSSITSIHVNSTYPVNGYVNGLLNSFKPMKTLGNNLYLTIHNNSNHIIYLYVDDVKVTIPNVTTKENGTFDFVKRPIVSSEYAPDNLSSSLRYIPIVSYGLDINYTSTKDYVIEFNLSDYNLGENISNIYIFKYAYNFTTRVVDFANRSNFMFLTPTIDNVSMTATITVSNFSMFILAKDTYVEPEDNNTNPPVNPPVNPPRRSSGGSSSGFPLIILEENETNTTNETIIEEPIVEPTCFDNIQNQNEIGVDCGGPCVSCPTGIDTNDKLVDSREELPEGFTGLKQEPIREKRSLTLWLMMALLVVGGLVAVGVVSTHHHTTNHLQSIISDTEAQDIVDVANFIQMHDLFDITLQDKDLIGMGFTPEKIGLARFALENNAMVKSVMTYLEDNQSKGYTTDELCNWLVSKDIHEGVVLLAKDRLSESKPSDVLNKYNSPFLPEDAMTKINQESDVPSLESGVPIKETLTETKIIEHKENKEVPVNNLPPGENKPL